MGGVALAAPPGRTHIVKVPHALRALLDGVEKADDFSAKVVPREQAYEGGRDRLLLGRREVFNTGHCRGEVRANLQEDKASKQPTGITHSAGTAASSCPRQQRGTTQENGQ